MSWICSSCATLNSESDTACIVCGTVRGAEEVSRDGDDAPARSPMSFFRRLFSGRRRELSPAQLKKRLSRTKPWRGHKIQFLADAILENGFVRCERKKIGIVEGYEFYRADGTKQFMKKDVLIRLHLVEAEEKESSSS